MICSYQVQYPVSINSDRRQNLETLRRKSVTFLLVLILTEGKASPFHKIDKFVDEMQNMISEIKFCGKLKCSNTSLRKDQSTLSKALCRSSFRTIAPLDPRILIIELNASWVKIILSVVDLPGMKLV